MKKNLRIVSAAAAALLAVAPVAATSFVAPATTVSAADQNAAKPTDYTNINLGGSTVSNTNNQVDVTPSLVLNGNVTNANKQVVAKASLTGSVSATFGGKSYTANLTGTDQDNITINGKNAKTELANIDAYSTNTIQIANVGFNFGSENKGKKVTLVSSNKNVTFSTDGKTFSKSVEVTLDQNGTAKDLTVKQENVIAFDATNTNGVVFYNVATGTQATDGTAMVLANTQGQLNVAALIPAVKSNFVAVQRSNSDSSTNGNGTYNQAGFVPVSDVDFATAIKDQLKAQNIDVDAQGYFKAPHSFKVNVKATSSVNGKSAELPVTFTVANVAEPTVNSVSKRIMHNAYYYDKDAKRVGTDSAKRYDSVNVLPNTTTIAGKTYYQVVENGKAVDKYINAANIDGTKRTLKHNAYVYATSKKRANKVVLKKGEVVTTYGASYTFKNGQKYYKIGDNTDKTYVKVANFR